jgi:hypothetical protein
LFGAALVWMSSHVQHPCSLMQLPDVWLAQLLDLTGLLNKQGICALTTTCCDMCAVSLLPAFPKCCLYFTVSYERNWKDSLLMMTSFNARCDMLC